MKNRNGIRKLDIWDFHGIDRLNLDLTDGLEQALRLVLIGGDTGKTTVLEAVYNLLQKGSADKTPQSEHCRNGTTNARLQAELAFNDRGRIQLSFEVRPEGSMWCCALPPMNVLYLPANRTITKADITGLEESFVAASCDQQARIQEVWDKLNSEKSTIQCNGFDVTFRSESKHVALRQLGLSALTMFALLQTFVLHNSTFDVVLIDEPELHLRQNLHRRLIDVLQKDLAPEAQIWLATNSDEIWDMAFSYERFFLVDENDPRARKIP